MNDLTSIVKDKIKREYKSVRGFAKSIDIPYTTIMSALEKGLGGTSVDYVIRMCDALEIDISEWQKSKIKNQSTSDYSPQETEHIKKYRMIDTYGKMAVDSILEIEYERCASIEDEKEEHIIYIPFINLPVSAGFGAELFDDIENSTIAVPDTPTSRKADYALKVKGDSMEPVYYNNDIIIIEETSAVDIGDIGIFILNNEGYVKEFGGDRLISLNDNYDDIILNEYDEFYVKGLVIGKM